MDDIAIRVEGLSKRYRIGAQQQAYKTLREKLNDAALAPFRAARHLVTHNGKGNSQSAIRNSKSNLFWALKDVSFEVKRGEVVGIIGRNGAGKSTLLKILSRITEPTEGYADMHGRIASLLEVGTGFHPELTGRENIYLNGSILGMKRAEINKKFDEIVAFSEIDKFIDTPVKYYSSGMYVRLAFAVAAHLDPEILLVDEVLAVGDATFQKKCLGKMSDVAKEGRTVFFVSHNMPAILNLCPKAILFDLGRKRIIGDCQKVVEEYLSGIRGDMTLPLNERSDRRGNKLIRFTSVEFKNSNGISVSRAYSGQDISIILRYESNTTLRNVNVALGVHGRFDENLFHLSTSTSSFDFEELPARGELTCRIPCLPLQAGRYSFNLFSAVAGDIADWVENAGFIEVEPGDFFESGRLPPIDQGPFMVSHSWKLSS